MMMESMIIITTTPPPAFSGSAVVDGDGNGSTVVGFIVVDSVGHVPPGGAIISLCSFGSFDWQPLYVQKQLMRMQGMHCFATGQTKITFDLVNSISS